MSYKYIVEGKGEINIKNNYLVFNIDTKTLIDVFEDFLESIKNKYNKKYILYQGDNPFLRDNYLTKNDTTVIYLRPYTYNIKSEYLEEKDYSHIFKERGNWEKEEDSNNYSDFLYIQGSKFLFDRESWKIESFISNNADRNSFTSMTKKDKLKNLLSPYMGEKFLNKHMYFELTPKLNPIKYKEFIEKEKYLILKPTDGAGGKDIYVIDSYEKFVEIIKKIKQFKNKENWTKKKTKKNNRITKIYWILEKYMINPYLYQGKKFHFRIFYIKTNNSTSYLFDKFRLAVAAKKYIKKDFDNTLIHDTHFVKNEEKLKLIFLDDILNKKDYNYVYNQILILFEDIDTNLNLGCYDNSELCFEIFAADIMLEENLNVKLLELNTNPGFNIESKFPVYMLENCMYHIIDKIMPPKNKNIKIKNHFIALGKNKIGNPRGLSNTSICRTGGLTNTSICRTGGLTIDQNKFIRDIVINWYKEGFGPIPKKDKTGGYYLTCSNLKEEKDFHIHLVGPGGKYNPNSWSKKVIERRRWQKLDFNLTAKEQAYHIYVKSGFKNNPKCK